LIKIDLFTFAKHQFRLNALFSGASRGEFTIVPILRPLPCQQGRGTGEGYVKLIGDLFMKTKLYSQIILGLFAVAFINVGLFATKFSVDVRDFEFSPSTLLNVRIGDTIHWEWKSGNHTTTSKTIPAGAASWDKPISSTNMSFDYIPTVTGIYSYKCTPHESMGMVGSFTVTSPTGIPDGSSPGSISLYPNPFVDKITIRVQAGATTRIDQVRIFDVSGKILREYSLTEWDAKLGKVLSLKDLPVGILFIEFHDNSGQLFLRKVVHEL
jgi:plastocyanin